MANNNRPVNPPPPLDVVKVQKYICPGTGCAAGDFCQYANSATARKHTPTTRYKCFNCNGKVHQEYSCAETLETLMERGHTFRHEYLGPHGLQCFEDAVECLNGSNQYKPVPNKDVWHDLQNELMCLKCFEEYSNLLQQYYDAKNYDEDGEEPQEQPTEEDAAQDGAQVPAWSHTNTWADLHSYNLEDLQLPAWLNHKNAYGKERPMFAVVAMIGVAIIGDSECIILFGLAFVVLQHISLTISFYQPMRMRMS